MNDLTRRLVEEVQDLDGDLVIVFQRRAQDKDTDRSRFHRFEILDEVFKDFLETNSRSGRRGQEHLTLGNLLHINHTNPRYFRYEHAGIPYLATVFLHEDTNGDWVNVKLCNNGFFYVTKRVNCPISRHNEKDWILLNSAFDYFTSTKAFLKDHYSSYRCFYHNKHRFDMKFFNPKNGLDRNLIVTYEDGTPYNDESSLEAGTM